MDSNAIKALLEKYWEGESSLEEEASLRAYFNQDSIAEELKAFQPMFRFFTQEQDAYLNGDFDERLSSKLQAADNRKPRRHSLTISIRRIAAVAAILVGALFFANYFFKDIGSTNGGEFVMNDIEKSEAKAAYAEAKAALLLISGKLNKGTDKAQESVVKVRKATKIIRE